MAEPDTPPQQVVNLKEYVDQQFDEIRRAVDVARAGTPPHVTIQEYFEMLLNEREKAVQLALTAADKLEQERIARSADLIQCERRVSELTRELSDTAINKAEAAADKRFDDLEKQITALREELQIFSRGVG